jgi:hypothetical protein
VSLLPVEGKLDELGQAIHAIPHPVTPKEVDLDPLSNRIEDLRVTVSEIPHPKAVDLSPIEKRIADLAQQINAIPAPEKQRVVDLNPIVSQLDSVGNLIRSIPVPVISEQIDIAPLLSQIGELRQAIRGIPVVETQTVDTQPLQQQLLGLSANIKSILSPKSVDLDPLNTRLDRIEIELASLGVRIGDLAVPAVPVISEPVILRSAQYGEKDDLKLISGVGPTLEKLLNHNGIYYFWQMSDWTINDIEIMDDRLDVFKGRIVRDSWVDQANRLELASNAAKRP